MQYGKRPEGMSDAEWLVECQCRTAARAMKAGRNRAELESIFEQWKRITPGITRERIREIRREGVPMPDKRKGERA